ncbi:MAG: DUF6765 family protein [Spirochaetota bacterium]
MNVEFHYYTIYYLARQAGFPDDDCRVLAYSSQYLDNALVSYEVRHPRGVYETLVTHHFGFWDNRQEWDVWIPFHFYPGGRGVARPTRLDGATNPLDVQPGSPPAKATLVAALKSRNLYRVGIALHTYADTWAHRNFTGRNEEWNRIDANSPIPPIGHAQARRDPDVVDAQWIDPRLAPPENRVNNRTRFLAAAGRIYRYLATYNRRGFEDEGLVVDRLNEILGPAEHARESRRENFIIECGMEPFSRLQWRKEAFEPVAGWNRLSEEVDLESTIDKLNWLKDEILHKTNVVRREPVIAKETFFASHLYRWDQAAREQKAAALAALAELRSEG